MIWIWKVSPIPNPAGIPWIHQCDGNGHRQHQQDHSHKIPGMLRGGTWGWLGKVLEEPNLLNMSFPGQGDIQGTVNTPCTCWDAPGKVLEAALDQGLVGNPVLPVCAGIFAWMVALEFLAFKREHFQKPGECGV